MQVKCSLNVYMTIGVGQWPRVIRKAHLHVKGFADTGFVEEAPRQEDSVEEPTTMCSWTLLILLAELSLQEGITVYSMN